jgi:hypothetical protein
VLIDCANKSIKLTTPDGKELEYVAEPVVTAKGVANHARLNQLDASQGPMVPVVIEFPDVFSEELPSMPPYRDIEFVIDLKPGAAPIYKSPIVHEALFGIHCGPVPPMVHEPWTDSTIFSC